MCLGPRIRCPTLQNIRCGPNLACRASSAARAISPLTWYPCGSQRTSLESYHDSAAVQDPGRYQDHLELAYGHGRAWVEHARAFEHCLARGDDGAATSAQVRVQGRGLAD